jgi:hypothetical protein
VRSGDGQLPIFVFVSADQTGRGRDVTMNRKDVNEIQPAQAAIDVIVQVARFMFQRM